MTTCERYAEQESAERYVAGRMTADEAADFEQHFLACDACLADRARHRRRARRPGRAPRGNRTG